MEELTPEQKAEQEAAAGNKPDPKDQQIAELNARIADLNKIVMDPAFAEFVASKGKPGGERKTEASASEREEFKERLEKMSRPELLSFISSFVVEKVKEELFVPMQRMQIADRVRGEVAKVAAKYSDFESMKPAMIQIAEANPSLGAEEVYLLAKAKAPKEERPPVRKPSGELPSGSQGGARPKPAAEVSFENVFDEAFAKAGFKE